MLRKVAKVRNIGVTKREERRKIMFRENLVALRKLNNISQEELAEKVGISRQTLSKYETGESVPDIDKATAIADVFGVSIDDLVNYNPAENEGLGVPPRGKHMFGMVKVGDKGQIVIPARARKIFDIQPGDNLIVLGDEAQGIAIIKQTGLMNMLNMAREESGK